MTKKQKTKKLILIIFLLLVCIVLIHIYKNPKEQVSTSAPLLNSQTPTINNNNPIKIIPEKNNLEFIYKGSTEITVYDYMLQLENEGKMNFETKTYSGMGEFVETINDIKNAEKNWIYYVNGQKATVGVSNYKINYGDIVSWKYEKDL
jgi:hypothetical protein